MHAGYLVSMRRHQPSRPGVHFAGSLLSRTVIALVLWMALASPAFAHVPALEPSVPADEPARIGGPDVSRAIYGYLDPSESADLYEFDVEESVGRVVGLLVPAHEEHADFRPTLIVEADGIEPLTIEDPGASPRETEWEPFSLTTFWVGGENRVRFEEGRRYTLRVQPGGGDNSGRYVIVFSGPEEFSGSDTATTTRILPRIWFGAYDDAPWRWNWYGALVLLVVLAIIAAAVLAVIRVARSVRGRSAA